MPQRVESNDSNPVPHCRCVIAHRCPDGRRETFRNITDALRAVVSRSAHLCEDVSRSIAVSSHRAMPRWGMGESWRRGFLSTACEPWRFRRERWRGPITLAGRVGKTGPKRAGSRQEAIRKRAGSRQNPIFRRHPDANQAGRLSDLKARGSFALECPPCPPWRPPKADSSHPERRGFRFVAGRES